MQQSKSEILYEANWRDIVRFGQIELVKLSDFMGLPQKRYLELNEDQNKLILLDEKKIPKKQFDYRYLIKDRNSMCQSYVLIKNFIDQNLKIQWSKDQALRQQCTVIRVDFHKQFTLMQSSEKSIKEKSEEIFILNLHFEFPKYCLERFTKTNELIKIYPNNQEIMKWDFLSYCKKNIIQSSMPFQIYKLNKEDQPYQNQSQVKLKNTKIEQQHLIEQALNLKVKEKWIPQILEIEAQQITQYAQKRMSEDSESLSFLKFSDESLESFNDEGQKYNVETKVNQSPTKPIIMPKVDNEKDFKQIKSYSGAKERLSIPIKIQEVEQKHYEQQSKSQFSQSLSQFVWDISLEIFQHQNVQSQIQNAETSFNKNPIMASSINSKLSEQQHYEQKGNSEVFQLQNLIIKKIEKEQNMKDRLEANNFQHRYLQLCAEFILNFFEIDY